MQSETLREGLQSLVLRIRPEALVERHGSSLQHDDPSARGVPFEELPRGRDKSRHRVRIVAADDRRERPASDGSQPSQVRVLDA